MIIDEISMVRSDMLDAIDKSLKLNRASKRPFGGVRMILSGDLHQLPPVVSGQEAPILRERYGGSYFFNAPAFKDAEFSLLALKHVFRQAEPRFLALLGALCVLSHIIIGATALLLLGVELLRVPGRRSATTLALALAVLRHERLRRLRARDLLGGVCSD